MESLRPKPVFASLRLLLWLILGTSGGILVQWWFGPNISPLLSSLVPGDNTGFACAKPDYTTRILMYDPFMMHIENFVTPEERQHLIELGEPGLQPSKIMLDNGTEALNEVRTSRSVFLPRKDPVSMCIMKRAAEIQGNLATKNIEELQITAYSKDQRYYPHFDWFEPDTIVPSWLPNRASTFFATLEATCDGCGTRFPRLQLDLRKRDEQICSIVDCEESEGLTVHAMPGAAVFWRNLNNSGLTDERTLHEGLPLASGSKIGLNIWTRGR